MTVQELHRAVARATGEDVSLIAERGFSLLDDDSSPDDELQDRFLDWDDADLRSARG